MLISYNIQSPKIFSSCVDNVICFMGTGMIESMLEPHMKENANASQTDVGLTFMIYALVYTVAGLSAGYVNKEYRNHYVVGLFFKRRGS